MSRITTSHSSAATLFAGPGTASNSTPSVGENVSFRFVLDGTVQTLSDSHAPSSGQISGLLFVPTLEPLDPCNSATAPYVPANVTRHDDIWQLGYPAIGLAPWVSVECTLSFLESSQKGGAQSLIFYQPSSDDTDRPPPSSDPCWRLNDGGAWKVENDYPVYAVPGPAGATLMRELSWYSSGDKGGNETRTFTQYRSSDRLFAMIDLNDPESQMPSLWSFILAILGTVVVLGLILMILYRLVQRRRRQLLSRRIHAGEVDLEYLALNQIKVPHSIVEKMPLYIYQNIASPSEATLAKEHTQPHVIEVTPESEATPKSLDEEPKEVSLKEIGLRKPEAAVLSSPCAVQAGISKDHFRLSHSQTTCAICLDDFVAGSSMVRELPCGHIFDPGCIDQFLTENSSLCPLCKKSVLPLESCSIQVTNEMVQRDYIARHSQ